MKNNVILKNQIMSLFVMDTYTSTQSIILEDIKEHQKTVLITMKDLALGLNHVPVVEFVHSKLLMDHGNMERWK